MQATIGERIYAHGITLMRRSDALFERAIDALHKDEDTIAIRLDTRSVAERNHATALIDMSRA